MSVLLVDDDRECQEVVQKTLREDGLSVFSANDGLSGLDAAISEKPDLILADFHLQGIDILSFVKKIRRRVYLAETPIILLFSKEKEENVDADFLQSAGIQSILNKPIDPILLSREVLQNIGPVVKEEPLPISIPLSQEPPKMESEAVVRLPAIDEETLRKNILESVEKVAWDIVPTILEKALSQKTLHSLVEQVLQGSFTKLLLPDALEAGEDQSTDGPLQKHILESIEKVAWDVMPGVFETAIPKETLKSIVERVVWETVPPLAEIEIKKEIKRLQPDEGFS